MTEERFPSVPPGEYLLEEIMKPLEISQNALARALKVTPRRINEIVHGKRAVTVLAALRLFGMFPEFWLNMQRQYEMGLAEDAGLINRIDQEVIPRETETQESLHQAV